MNTVKSSFFTIRGKKNKSDGSRNSGSNCKQCQRSIKCGRVRAKSESRRQGSGPENTASERVQRISSANSQSPQTKSGASRREFLHLSSTSMPLFLASIFHFNGTKPTNLGVSNQTNSLKSCPHDTHNCISTAEEKGGEYYGSMWRYREGESREEALSELIETINSTSPSDFTPTIIENNNKDYVRAEYESPTFGFVDDVEFYLPGDGSSSDSIEASSSSNVVQYRSASRLGDSDFGVNTTRIQVLFEALRDKGWTSV